MRDPVWKILLADGWQEQNFLLHALKNKQTKNLRCGNRKGLLGRNDQTHHRMGPKTMESIPPSKRNTQADIQLRTRQTNHQQETDGCIQIKHNPEHQPSRMSSKSTALCGCRTLNFCLFVYVPPKTASTPTKANTQTCSYLDFNQFLIVINNTSFYTDRSQGSSRRHGFQSVKAMCQLLC